MKKALDVKFNKLMHNATTKLEDQRIENIRTQNELT